MTVSGGDQGIRVGVGSTCDPDSNGMRIIIVY